MLKHSHLDQNNVMLQEKQIRIPLQRVSLTKELEEYTTWNEDIKLITDLFRLE